MDRRKSSHPSASSSGFAVTSLSDASDDSDDDFWSSSHAPASGSTNAATVTSKHAASENLEDGFAMLKRMRENDRSSDKSINGNNKRARAAKFKLSDDEEDEKPRMSTQKVQGKLESKVVSGKKNLLENTGAKAPAKAKTAQDLERARAKLAEIDLEWSPGDDEVSVEETVNWMRKCEEGMPDPEELGMWAAEREIDLKQMSIANEDHFCDVRILRRLLECKTILDTETSADIETARSKVNPFELTGKHCFMNRAALKMANIDAVFDWMFTNPKTDGGRTLISDSGDDLLYFADICAGPGGFTEYVLWKRKWHAHGFGFTLKGENDFKPYNIQAGPAEAFEAFYGPEDENNICSSKNLELFAEHVKKNTVQDGKSGVHFVVADGAFSVTGQENIQELLYKRLYLCQMLCALMVLREGGHFVCRLCDIFTPFSVGLIYLMYRCFDRISIHKPNTSRPASSERYIICRNLQSGTDVVQQYLFDLNLQFDALVPGQDLMESLPLDVINHDEEFVQFIQNSNEKIAATQSLYLAKIIMFINGNFDERQRQEALRDECLRNWQLNPQSSFDVRRAASRDIQSLFRRLRGSIPFDRVQLSTIPLSGQVSNLLSYRAVVSGGTLCLVLGLGRAEVRLAPVKVGRFEGLSGIWESMSARSDLKNVHLQLPAETLLLGEFVEEITVSGTVTRKTKALHIVDAYWLGKELVGNKPYDVRMRRAKKFARSIVQTGKDEKLACVLRVKNVHKAAEMHEAVGRLQLFRPRNMRFGMMVTESVSEDTCYGVHGMHFIPITKNPWKMVWSNTQQNCYVFNTSNGKTSTSLNEGIFADACDAVSNWKTWQWTTETGVVDERVRLRCKDTLYDWLEAAKTKK